MFLTIYLKLSKLDFLEIFIFSELHFIFLKSIMSKITSLWGGCDQTVPIEFTATFLALEKMHPASEPGGIGRHRELSNQLNSLD